jgi:hypothetical protein
MDLAMRVSEKDARFWSIKSVECTVGCRVRLGLRTMVLMMFFCADMNTSPADLATIDDPESVGVCLCFNGVLVFRWMQVRRSRLLMVTVLIEPAYIG